MQRNLLIGGAMILVTVIAISVAALAPPSVPTFGEPDVDAANGADGGNRPVADTPADRLEDAELDPLDYAILTAVAADEANTVDELSRLRRVPRAEILEKVGPFVEHGLLARREGSLALTDKGDVALARVGTWLRDRNFQIDATVDPLAADDEPLIVEEPKRTPEGMVWIPGGTFRMGDRRGAPDKHPEHLDVIPEHQDERYEHAVALDGFWMDATEVTNAQFAEFVEATGYETKAERGFTAADFAGQVEPDKLAKEAFDPSSICFNSAFDPKDVDKRDPSWVYKSGIWTVRKGASWRHPEGPGSNIGERMDHPVVHVSWEDAVAYGEWAGKQLPTEAQWEYAARGGLDGQPYPWGKEPKPGDTWPHNIWQGDFPFDNRYAADDGGDGFLRTSPVKSFPANGHGLYDMTGNVWEWCADKYRPDYYAFAPTRNPTGPKSSLDPSEPRIPKRVQRGGSFMCSDTYCIGYSVASRMKGEPTTGSFHCGFRCIIPAK